MIPSMLSARTIKFSDDLALDLLNTQSELVLNTNAEFCDYRITYGVKTMTPQTVYFINIYPSFCTAPKFTKHYMDLDEFIATISNIEEALENIGKLSTDIIATIFAILRDKESIELFQEQKDLMTLGLKHTCLDNYYQESIKKYVEEYRTSGTVLGKVFDLLIFSKETSS